MKSKSNASDHTGGSGLFFEGQWLHLLALVVLLAGCAWAAQLDIARHGDLWGQSSSVWYWVAILTAATHQVYVWLCWRAELHGGHLTRWFAGKAFPMFAIGFAIAGILRVITVFVAAYANRGTVEFEPALLMKIAALVALLPALYLFYSVRRYFSFRRAFGADHFDPSVRDLPFVRKGIFRFSPNSMYVFGFLLLWVPVLWWSSAAALFVALFNHLYIWVHYFATERPDIKRMYANKVEA